MQRRWLKVLALAVIGAGSAAACDRPAPVTSPSGSAPRMSTSYTPVTLGGYTLLTTSGTAAQTKSTVIDQWGGKINFGANALQVPAGAVTGPTKFTFTLQSQPYISAKLTAVQVTLVKNQWVETGVKVATFGAPLTLTLSYAGARESVPDPSVMKVLWIENGVILGVLPAQAEVKGKKLITDVTHFTDYTPGVPGPNPCDPSSLTPCGDNSL